jgi:hypothetical protein
MAWVDAFAPAIARQRQEVLRETWGHLAPIRNKTYKGRIVWATGCLGSDDLNPVCLAFELGDLDSSPWFYDVLQDFMQDNPGDAGCVYEFIGTFRNYKFKGKIRLIVNTNT